MSAGRTLRVFTYDGNPNGHMLAPARGYLCVDYATPPSVWQAQAQGKTHWAQPQALLYRYVTAFPSDASHIFTATYHTPPRRSPQWTPKWTPAFTGRSFVGGSGIAFTPDTPWIVNISVAGIYAVNLVITVAAPTVGEDATLKTPVWFAPSVCDKGASILDLPGFGRQTLTSTPTAASPGTLYQGSYWVVRGGSGGAFAPTLTCAISSVGYIAPTTPKVPVRTRWGMAVVFDTYTGTKYVGETASLTVARLSTALG